MTTPTPDPNNPPSRVDDWKAWNAEKQRALHPAPTDDEAATIRDNLRSMASRTKAWININPAHVLALCDAYDALRARTTLTDYEQHSLDRAREQMMRKGSVDAVFASDLVDALDRLTRDGADAEQTT